MNLLKTLWTEISNCSRYKMLSILFCSAFFIYAYGCQVKCDSILRPGTKITFKQLQAETDEFCSRAQAEANDIAKQEEFRAFLWNTGINVASTGTFNWLQFLLGAGTILGMGATADNIRYRIKFPKA